MKVKKGGVCIWLKEEGWQAQVRKQENELLHPVEKHHMVGVDQKVRRKNNMVLPSNIHCVDGKCHDAKKCSKGCPYYKNMSKTKEVEIEEKIEYEKGPGMLGFLLWWQTLDGRLQIEYYDTLTEAVNHASRLNALGRKAQIWRKIKC